MGTNFKTIFIIACFVLSSTVLSQGTSYHPTLNTEELRSIEAGEIIMRELKTEHDKGQTIETLGLMHTSGENLVKLLTDYKAYPEFMSAVDLIEIVDTAGVETTLNYILRPMLGLTKKYRIRIAPVLLAEQVWKIEWSLVEWPGLTKLETLGDTRGYWLIIEQAENRSLVQYYVYSDPGYVPFGLGRIVDAIGRDSIEEVFLETRAQAEKMMGKP